MTARLLVALLLVSAPLYAQEASDDEVPGSKQKETPAAHADDEDDEPSATGKRPGDGALHTVPGNADGNAHYGGVAPGAQNLPPKAPRLPLRKGPQRLTWSGFQVKEGVPTVFIETTGAPDYTVDARGDEVVVTLKNTVVPIKNNRRPLRVEAFGTPVKTVETTTRGKETRVVIHTSGTVAHKERVEPAAGGFQMLLIELGAR